MLQKERQASSSHHGTYFTHDWRTETAGLSCVASEEDAGMCLNACHVFHITTHPGPAFATCHTLISVKHLVRPARLESNPWYFVLLDPFHKDDHMVCNMAC